MLVTLRGQRAKIRLDIVFIIAELAERSPIIIQNGSSNPSSRKKIWTYDRTVVRSYGRTVVRSYVRPYKVLLLTCVVNCTAGTPTPRLCPVVQWSVHWAPSRTTRVLVLAGARYCALETYGKKIRAPLLGLAKSINYAWCNTEGNNGLVRIPGLAL